MRMSTELCALTAALALLTGGRASGQRADAGYKLPRPTVETESPYHAKYVDVAGQTVAYVESGAGVPVVFIHGNPTSSHLWRNVMPFVEQQGRAIALDLPGMGSSSKPTPALRFVDQAEAFDRFVAALDLRGLVLVVHDWGAAIGFDYARRHADNVRGIVFMEAVLPPIFPQPSFEAMGEEMGGMFRALKDPVRGRELVIEQNMFVEQVLPGFVNRPFGASDLDPYRRPFLDPQDREALLMWPREIPIAGDPADVVQRLELIEQFMTTTATPMLLLYAEPGVLVPPTVVGWYTQKVDDIETAFVGQGFHFIQEDQPRAIGRALSDWMRRRVGNAQ